MGRNLSTEKVTFPNLVLEATLCKEMKGRMMRWFLPPLIIRKTLFSSL
jgi:hypothetical protein